MKVWSLVAHKLWPRLKFLSTEDEADTANDNADTAAVDAATGALTIVLRTFVTVN